MSAALRKEEALLRSGAPKTPVAPSLPARSRLLASSRLSLPRAAEQKLGALRSFVLYLSHQGQGQGSQATPPHFLDQKLQTAPKAEGQCPVPGHSLSLVPALHHSACHCPRHCALEVCFPLLKH